jgi:hypothetical protein
MFTRLLAVAAFATLSAAAQAGTIQNGTWASSAACKDPGDAPAISDKSPEAYNKTAKLLQAYQVNAQAYATCVQSEAKADQGAIVDGANGAISKVNDQLKGAIAANDAAIAKLKAKK